MSLTASNVFEPTAMQQLPLGYPYLKSLPKVCSFLAIDGSRVVRYLATSLARKDLPRLFSMFQVLMR